jgi:hypothetical protein
MQNATQDGFYITIGTRCNESRLNTSFLGTVSNDRDIGSLSNHQTDCFDKHCLARTGLAGKSRKSGIES